ncbi:response regulator [Herbaspirillum sp. RTI4]|uniref:response regulator n=1 Tax=Herbaspirillum sp. RTI4 TaxID=3048640 RepID=UPI002AB46A00|nr:response regulator [Herbaspirillum sp. RTI4]MDY7578231.1 response regulator [Herbaspirillum sp. RTI4]MEA9981569.1 response regulator [Herbaspirillum sp. RTI4]
MSLPDDDGPKDNASRVLLLVDDEKNILSALNRLLRRDDYTILMANSGAEALEILSKTHVDVIVSDQRMPGMSGVEFFRIAKKTHPDSVRIVLSGYTELESVTAAVNEGSIYKFLTKPWDDVQLSEQIAEAFRKKFFEDEIFQLTEKLSKANAGLELMNGQLDAVLQRKETMIRTHEISLKIVHEILQHLPVPVIGLDETDTIVLANAAAQSLSGLTRPLLGEDIKQSMPAAWEQLRQDGTPSTVEISGERFDVRLHSMGESSQSQGKLMTFIKSPGRGS